MPNIDTTTAANVFYKARLHASKSNEALRSRGGAEELTGIDARRLMRIENGTSMPNPDEVLILSEIYCQAGLKNYYCRNLCPLGRDVPKVTESNLDRIVIRSLNAFKQITETSEKLLSITRDGVIHNADMGKLEEVLDVLDEISNMTASLRNWVEQNKKGGDDYGGIS
jgi:hypothetical protein